MKKLFFLCTLACSVPGTSQNLDLKWARALATNTVGTYIMPEQLATDQYKSVYAVGKFEGTIDFDPGTGIHSLTSSGNEDGFVVKLDSSGNFLWAAKFGDTGYDFAYDVAVDPSGNVVVVGAFQGTIDFDPGTGTHTLSAGNMAQTNAFACKYNTAGALVWAKNWGGYAAMATVVSTDNNGNIFTAGNFEGGGDLDPGSATYTLSSQGGGDLFINKLDANGNMLWVKGFGGPHYEYLHCMQIDNAGNIVMGGQFRATVDFDPGPGTYTLTAASVNFTDAFLMKLDGAGGFLWAGGFGAATNDDVDALTIDASNNIYITGFFQHVVDFDPGPGTYTLTNPGNFATMVCKYDAQGNIVWGISNHCNTQGGLVLGTGIALNGAGHVIVSGRLSTTNVDFDPGTGTFPLSSGGGEDMYIQTLTSSGAFVDAELMGGTNTDYVNDLVMNQDGSIFTCGLFQNVCDFDPGVGTSTLSTGSIQFSNGFVAKLRPSCLPTPMPVIDTVAVTYCKGDHIVLSATGGTGTITWYTNVTGGAPIGSGSSYTVPSSSTGVFTYYVEESGCLPSARAGVTVNITAPNVQVTTQTPTICAGQSATLQASGATGFQWSTQSTGSMIVVNPSSTTPYTVTGTDANGCASQATISLNVDACTGLRDERSVRIDVYPNPCSGVLNLSDDRFNGNERHVTIVDLTGRNVLETHLAPGENSIAVDYLPKGIYSLLINDATTNVQIRFIKE